MHISKQWDNLRQHIVVTLVILIFSSFATGFPTGRLILSLVNSIFHSTVVDDYVVSILSI